MMEAAVNRDRPHPLPLSLRTEPCSSCSVVISPSLSTEEIFSEASAQGMGTLRQDGFRLALAGISSLEEIRRVTGDRLS